MSTKRHCITSELFASSSAKGLRMRIRRVSEISLVEIGSQQDFQYYRTLVLTYWVDLISWPNSTRANFHYPIVTTPQRIRQRSTSDGFSQCFKNETSQLFHLLWEHVSRHYRPIMLPGCIVVCSKTNSIENPSRNPHESRKPHESFN